MMILKTNIKRYFNYQISLILNLQKPKYILSQNNDIKIFHFIRKVLNTDSCEIVNFDGRKNYFVIENINNHILVKPDKIFILILSDDNNLQVHNLDNKIQDRILKLCQNKIDSKCNYVFNHIFEIQKVLIDNLTNQIN